MCTFRGPGCISHVLPAQRSQAATSPPPSEGAGNTGAWLGEAPGSPSHGSLHSASGLKGLRVRTACVAGPAGSLWGKARRPSPSLPDQGGARQRRQAVDREQAWSWPQSFLPAATKGRPLGGWRGPFLERGWLSAVESLDEPRGPACRGVGLLCGRHPTRDLLRVNHLERDLELYPADTHQPGAREKPGQAPWKRATWKAGQAPDVYGVSSPCWARSAHRTDTSHFQGGRASLRFKGEPRQ